MTNYSFHSDLEFDQYAVNYDAALMQGVSVSGEDKQFFARGRLEWLAKCFSKMGEQPSSAMDMGCGTGTATPFFFEIVRVTSLWGVDTSIRTLDVARRSWNDHPVEFLLLDEYQPQERLDLVFCNGVFHHIPPDDREKAVNYVYRSLRPGGLFAFWENNPWNPGARYVMSRIPFDRDAIMLKPHKARQLLKDGGFQVERVDFQFVFPRALRPLRSIEPYIARWPFGAQYQVLCRKPRI